MMKLTKQGLRCCCRTYTTAVKKPTRDYYYDIDVHGQLFLSDTRMKNFTSCYKDPAFLDFFYSRLKPLPSYSDNAPEEGLEGREALKKQGYTYLSLCGTEKNYVRCQDTPIVFRELQQLASKEDKKHVWHLRYAGTLACPFQPNALRADPRGYLYHPSPSPAKRTRQKAVAPEVDNPYGPFSLIRSELVMSQLSKNLNIEEDGSGEYSFDGQAYRIERLASDTA